LIDMGGMVLDVSPSWLDILGHTSDEITGTKVVDAIWPEDRDIVKPSLKRAADNAHSEVELRMTHLDGSPRTISWMASREDDRAYAYGRDVTLERQQKVVLEETEVQLRQAQKMEAVGQLTGGIAHDFNNMLTGVIGAHSIIKRRISSKRTDDLDKFIDAATTSAHRAASLTHRLLAFSRRQSLNRQAVDIKQLVTSMRNSSGVPLASKSGWPSASRQELGRRKPMPTNSKALSLTW